MSKLVTDIRSPVSAEDVWNRASAEGLAEVVVVGWTKNNGQLVLDSNCGRHMEIHWLLQHGMNAILDECK